MESLIAEPKYSLADFSLPPDVGDSIGGWNRAKTALVICGRAGAGKTALAISLIGPDALLIRSLDQLKLVQEWDDIGGIVFDECRWKEWGLGIDQIKMLCDVELASALRLRYIK